MTNNELDNLIKNKLNNQVFEYQDAYWLAAEKMIDKQRLETKKVIWYQSAFYAAVATIFALMGWFLIDNNIDINKVSVNTVTETQATIPSELAPSMANDNVKLPNGNKSANKADKQVDINSVVNEQNTKKSTSNLSNKSAKKTKANRNNFPINTTDLYNINDAITNTQINTNKPIDDFWLTSKDLPQVEVNLVSPYFDFTQIEFVKTPNNYKKGPNKLGYFNASIEAGTNSFNNTMATNSFGYFVGGRLYFDIGKFSFNSNLHYENINQNLDARNVINKTYDFTSYTTTTTIKNQSIDYAIIGLNLMYPIFKNHGLGVGVQYAQLVKTNDLFTTNNLENNTITNKKTENYSTGISKNDIQFTFNYQFRFAKHLAVNATYVYGLNEVSTINNNKYKNQGIKLGLQYIIK